MIAFESSVCLDQRLNACIGLRGCGFDFRILNSKSSELSEEMKLKLLSLSKVLLVVLSLTTCADDVKAGT
jgi:hypothetical protein